MFSHSFCQVTTKYVSIQTLRPESHLLFEPWQAMPTVSLQQLLKDWVLICHLVSQQVLLLLPKEWELSCYLVGQVLKHGSAGVWDTKGSFGNLQHFLKPSVRYSALTKLVDDFWWPKYESVASATDSCDQVSHLRSQKKFRESIQVPAIHKKCVDFSITLTGRRCWVENEKNALSRVTSMLHET